MKKVLCLFNDVRNTTRNLSFGMRLLLQQGILVFILILAFTLLANVMLTYLLANQAQTAAEQALEQANAFLSQLAAQAENTSSQILFNKNVNEMMQRISLRDAYDTTLQVADMEDIRGFFYELERSAGVAGIRLYVPDGLIYSNEGQAFLNINEGISSPWYPRLMESNGISLWQHGITMPNTDAQAVSVLRVYKDPFKLSQMLGIVRVDIACDELERVLKGANTVVQGQVLLFDGPGQLIASTQQDSVNPAKILFALSDEQALQTWQSVHLEGEKALVRKINIDRSGWQLIGVLPVRALTQPSAAMRRTLFIAGALLLVVFMGLTMLVTRFSSRRIRMLRDSIRSVSPGELMPLKSPTVNDEVGELVLAFNDMTGKINRFMLERYESGISLKNAELKALQAQINPHFLYNTLDMINWMAIENKVPEISEMVVTLAKYFKLSLAKGRDVVPLLDELTHISLYITIQNQRMSGGIQLMIHVPDALMGCLLPKFTLQPIVENAILHGLMSKPDKKGTLLLKAREEGKLCVLSVQDDGVGFDTAKVDAQIGLNERSGYGIYNVKERLTLYFGEEAKLTCQSRLGEGSVFTLEFPKRYENGVG